MSWSVIVTWLNLEMRLNYYGDLKLRKDHKPVSPGIPSLPRCGRWPWKTVMERVRVGYRPPEHFKSQGAWALEDMVVHDPFLCDKMWILLHVDYCRGWALRRWIAIYMVHPPELPPWCLRFATGKVWEPWAQGSPNFCSLLPPLGQLRELGPAGRVLGCLSSSHPVRNSILCLLFPLSDAISTHHLAQIVPPPDVQGACGISGNLLGKERKLLKGRWPCPWPHTFYQVIPQPTHSSNLCCGRKEDVQEDQLQAPS
jgi:hypothetical protein